MTMPTRKNKAKQLAQREAFGEKKCRLIQALTQKLLVSFILESFNLLALGEKVILTQSPVQPRYGPNTERGLKKRQIVEVINDFFDHCPSLVKISTLHALDDLASAVEANLHNVPKLKKPEGKDSKPIDIKKVDERLSEIQSPHMPNKNTEVHNFGTDDNLSPWSLIEKYKILENGEAEQKGQHASEARKKEISKALNAQVKLKQVNLQLEKAEDAKFVNVQRNGQDDWEEEQRKLTIIEREKIEHLKKARQDQIEERVRSRESQKETQRAEELREIQNITKALAREEEDRYCKRQVEKKQWDLIKIENASKIEKKRQRAKEEQNMDAKLMADIKEKMDNEEAKRVNAIQHRKEDAASAIQRLDKNQNLELDMLRLKKREIRKSEQSQLLAAQERERALTVDDNRKKEALRARREELTESNKRIVDGKKRQEKAIEQENEAYATQCLKEVESVKKEEDIAIAKQRETQYQFRQLLDGQVQQKKEQLNTEVDGMTDVERSINKKIITDAELFLKDRKSLTCQGLA
jgi:hypothetical protein